MISRRDLLAGAMAAPPSAGSPFTVRATQECGWNAFLRKGASTSARGIRPNLRHLDYLAEAGLNWLLVFWTNAPEFDDAWQRVSEHAHSLGLRIGRAVYGFGGGGAEATMAEPNVPEKLLRDSKRGPRTAMCPFDPETRAWVSQSLVRRLQPDIDGIIIEPARETSRNCVCERCRTLRPFEWDVFTVNFIADELWRRKPACEVMLHMNATGNTAAANHAMSADLLGLRPRIRCLFGWGTDTESALDAWLSADPRFQAFTKMSRVLLFPDGTPPPQPVQERVANVFRWCRLAAGRGKTAWSFDWRLFGGTEWQGHKLEPSTRICRRLPASIALMGAALKNPYLDESGQREWLEALRKRTEWDLDNPEVFYRGATPYSA